ncbi:FSH1 domain-containing protein [Mycena sanguinolenta]|uniref:FSH1 domain-containing protein n=1 Tax=Mycena sanguinolenta TaxID=230812 RepID=A0A8H7D8S7_9AGAR|nr:FSH1 domain-containing protein [Mycena sanguinolenta]
MGRFRANQMNHYQLHFVISQIYSECLYLQQTSKIFCYGFYETNGSSQLGALRKECGKNVDLGIIPVVTSCILLITTILALVFVDGPIILQPVDLVGETPEALNAAETNDARAWWNWNSSSSEAVGLPESLQVVRDILKTRTFDGVMGFSQGAAFAALLAALLERPEAYPPFLVDGRAPHPPFKFCVAVSGFKLKDGEPIVDVVFKTPFSTPTLHIIGKNDVVVTEERSRTLVNISTSARVEEHDGG